jgi:hypothetical protein
MLEIWRVGVHEPIRVLQGSVFGFLRRKMSLFHDLLRSVLGASLLAMRFVRNINVD